MVKVNNRLAVIVLAAGASRRMGATNKLLVVWQGKALVCHVVETALISHADEVIVVTGHQAGEVRHELAGLDVRFVDNRRFNEGLSTSLASGIGALDEKCSGAAIMLADMPGLKVETLNRLVAAFLDNGCGAICVPVCAGRRGNPVIWPRTFFSEIVQLSGDRGARDLMTTYKERVVEIQVGDNGVLMDFDSPDDIA